LAPVAIALDARVRLVSAGGERVIEAAGLYRDDGIAYLGKRADEILVEIRVPPPDGWRATYWKLRRRGSIDFPILGVAAAVRLGGDGTVADARLALGAVASMPLRARDAERALIGRRLTAETIAAAADEAFKPARPLDNTDLTLRYRKQMVRVYVSRALKELAGLSVEEPPSRV
jgi:CO/xanthine dehydrogenase FAD-binding subunit